MVTKRAPLTTHGWADKSEPRAEPQIDAPPSVVDGRSLRRTGRTEQFATRIKAETKAQIQQIAREEGITMAEAVERAVADYRKAKEGKF